MGTIQQIFIGVTSDNESPKCHVFFGLWGLPFALIPFWLFAVTLPSLSDVATDLSLSTLFIFLVPVKIAIAGLS